MPTDTSPTIIASAVTHCFADPHDWAAAVDALADCTDSQIDAAWADRATPATYKQGDVGHPRYRALSAAGVTHVH